MAASHKGSYIRKGNVLSWSFKLGNVETGKVCFGVIDFSKTLQIKSVF